jgi:hypothetical protein
VAKHEWMFYHVVPRSGPFLSSAVTGQDPTRLGNSGYVNLLICHEFWTEN